MAGLRIAAAMTVQNRRDPTMAHPDPSCAPPVGPRSGDLEGVRSDAAGRTPNALLLKMPGPSTTQFSQICLLAKPLDGSYQTFLDINHRLPGQRRACESDIRLAD
jgi:hypothetical protein